MKWYSAATTASGTAESAAGAEIRGTLVGGYARRRNRIAQPLQRVESITAAPATHGAACNAQHLGGHAETRMAFRTLGVHQADLLLY